MPKILFTILIVLSLIIAHPAMAGNGTAENETAQNGTSAIKTGSPPAPSSQDLLQNQTNGLAMVGEPMMPAGFTHFNYADPTAPKGGTLKRAVFGSFDTLNPFALQGRSAQGLNLIYDRLMARTWDEPFTLYPLIAQSVEVPADRSSLTVHLNPLAKFSDGSKITADDVIFSFHTLKSKGRPNMRNIYKLVGKVEKIRAEKIKTEKINNGTEQGETVKFTLLPGYNRETVMILAMMPVLSKNWWTKKDFGKTILTAPISSGPYKITEISPGRRIVFERDPSYWAADLPVNKGQYNFDRVIFDYFRDQNSAFEAFKAGEVDLWLDTTPAHWAKSYDFPAALSQQVIKAAIPHQRVERIWGFIFNTRRPPFDNAELRRALSLMVDYDWLNRNIFYDQYRITQSFFPNSHLAATDPMTEGEKEILSQYKNELEPQILKDAMGAAWSPPPSGNAQSARAAQSQANQILNAQGWIIKDGQRVSQKTGRALSFEILLSSSEDEKLALSFQNALQKLGIKVTVRLADSATFQDRLNHFDYDMLMYFWLNTLSPGSEQAVYWGCESRDQPGRFNYAGICNAAIDGLISQIPMVQTAEDMTNTIHVLDRVLMAGHYVIPLFYSPEDHVAYWNFLRRPEHSSLYGPVFEAWWSGANLPHSNE